jgi:hypothetical protein
MKALFDLERDERATYEVRDLLAYYDARVRAVERAFFGLTTAARTDLRLAPMAAGTFTSTSDPSAVDRTSQVRNNPRTGG